MPRQPYSEAVKSDRRSGFLFFPEGEKTEMRGGAFLKGKEGRVGFRTDSTCRAITSLIPMVGI